MKTILFAGVALLTCSAGMVSANDKTSVIPKDGNSIVVIEQDGKPPAVIDVNKDIKGKTEKAKSSADADREVAEKPDTAQSPGEKANSGTSMSAGANESAEVKGEPSRDADGNLVKKPKKNCIKESWMGDRPNENCS